ncbi:MAG: J domain-containing protein [bacterium]
MNPYLLLGIPENMEDDDAIHNAWLDAVRRFPPDQHSEQFTRIREAYEMIRDRESRFRLRTFGDRRLRDIGALIGFFPVARNHAGAALWLATTRRGTR